jgi:GNAT superfamily N-acetyltransferase
MNAHICSLAERPDLADQLYDAFEGAWPEFMLRDPVDSLLDPLTEKVYPHLTFVAVDAASGRLIAKSYAVPFTWPGDPDHDLPPGGYDACLLGAARDRLLGQTGNLLALIEITVRPDAQGAGLAVLMLTAVKAAALEQGYPSLVLPVRPTGAHQYPEVPLAEYAARTRADGLPVDPWLRVHVRAGGRVVGMAPYSMVITGGLPDWRQWTGLPFDSDGPVAVPGALAPVRCNVALGVGVYVEPTVWVHYQLR